MRKKSLKSKEGKFFVDGKPASLKQLSMISNLGKIRNELGEQEYAKAQEIHKLTGITPAELQDWYKQGLIHGVKDGTRWVYPLADVVKAIKQT